MQEPAACPTATLHAEAMNQVAQLLPKTYKTNECSLRYTCFHPVISYLLFVEIIIPNLIINYKPETA